MVITYGLPHLSSQYLSLTSPLVLLWIFFVFLSHVTGLVIAMARDQRRGVMAPTQFSFCLLLAFKGIGRRWELYFYGKGKMNSEQGSRSERNFVALNMTPARSSHSLVEAHFLKRSASIISLQHAIPPHENLRWRFNPAGAGLPLNGKMQ